MLLLLVSVLLGLLTCHLLEGESSGALVVATTTAASTVLSSAVDVVRGVLAAALGVPLFVVGHFVWVTRLLGLVGLAWIIHEFPVNVLETCDAFFRRVLNPTVAFLESLSFLIRVVYEPWCVLYNMVVSILRTSVQGSLYLASKCSVELMVSLVKGSLELVVVFFKSFFKWLGSPDGGGGGLLKNEFDFVPVFEGVQTLVSNAVELTDCVCEEMSNGVRVFVAFVTPPAAARAANHWWNVPIRLLQEVFDAVSFQSYPTGKHVYYHIEGGILETGKWLDAGMLEGASVLLNKVLKQRPIATADRPDKFIGSALASLGQAAAQLVYVVVRTVTHFVLPFNKLDDPAYMLEVMSPRQVFGVWVREFVNTASLSAWWTLEYGHSRIVGNPAPTPRLDCSASFKPAHFGDRYFQSMACAARSFGRALTTALAVATTVPVEIGSQAVLGGNRNFWTTLQRYDGQLQHTELYANSCEMRRDTSFPGWDLTTDASRCVCVDEDASFSRVLPYDPDVWSSLTMDKDHMCAQPQLQDALRDWRDGSERLGDVIVPFASPAATTTLKAVGETISTVVRLVTSLNDILDDHFFPLPITGTGQYGAREDLAHKAWVARGGAVSSPGCAEGFISHQFEGDKTAQCRELGVVARLDLAFKRQYKGQPLCQNKNEEGCTCNAALEMLEDSACDCNLLFADQETTASDSYGETRWRMDAFRKHGWCGSQLSEGLWEMLEQESGTAVAALANAFTPGAEELNWCGKQEYLIVETDINWYLSDEFDSGFLASRGIGAAGKEEIRARVLAAVKAAKEGRAAANLTALTAEEDARLLLEETLLDIETTQGPRAAANATNGCLEQVYGKTSVRLQDVHPSDLGGLADCFVDKTAERSLYLNNWDFQTREADWLYEEERQRGRGSMCKVRGHHDLICSVSEAVSKGSEAYIGLGRQAINSAVAIITGHGDKVRFTISDRMCDAQKFWGAVASAATTMIDVRQDAQKALAKFLFLLLDLQVEYGAQWDALFRLLSDLIKDVLWNTDEDAGGFSKFVNSVRTATKQPPSRIPFKRFTLRLMSIYTKWLQLMLQSFGDFIDAYADGGGAFFQELGNLVAGLEEGLSDMFLDIIMLFAGITTDFMRICAGEVGMLPSLLVRLYKIFPTLKKIFVKAAFKIVHLILTGLGPVGKFLSKLVGTLCTLIEGTLNIIVSAVNFISAGFAGLEEQDFGCIDSWIGADAGASRNNTRHRRNLNDVPQIAFELGWDGTTFCDGYMNGMSGAKWHSISVLEQQTMLSCLQYRRVGAELASMTGILDLERVAFDYFALFGAAKHFLKAAYAHFDEMSPRQASSFLDEVELQQYLPALQTLSSTVSSTFTPETTASMIGDVVMGVAEIVQAAAPKGSDLELALKSSTALAHKTYTEWNARNISKVGAQLLDVRWAIPTLQASPKNRRLRTAASHPVVASARRKLNSVLSGGKQTAKNIVRGYTLGASRPSVLEDPCGSEYSLACTNCKLLDNILVTGVEEFMRASQFLHFYYGMVTLPQFARHVKKRGFDLQNGATFAAKDLFANPTEGRVVNRADEFDRMAVLSGANQAQSDMNDAKGTPLDLLFVARSLYQDQLVGTSTLGSLRARGNQYNLGGSLADDIAETLRRDREEPIDIMYRTRAERAAIDWSYLLEHFPYLPRNTSASYLTNTDQAEIKEVPLWTAVGLYLSTTTNEWVPLFQHGLFYSLSLPLLKTCDQDVVLYSSTTTQSERMERFDSALITTGLVGLVVLWMQWWVGLPFVAICAPATAGMLWYLWLYFVYGYTLNCSPSLPVHLANDVGAYVNRWYPEPLCARFPALAGECDMQTSIQFNGTTEWASCFENKAIEELGYAYSSVFYFKTWYPDWYNYLRRVQPSSRYYLSDWAALDALDDPMDAAIGQVFFENCARLLFMDGVGLVSLSAVAGWLVFTLVVPIVASLARSAVALSVQIGGMLGLLLLSLSKVEV